MPGVDLLHKLFTFQLSSAVNIQRTCFVGFDVRFAFVAVEYIVRADVDQYRSQIAGCGCEIFRAHNVYFVRPSGCCSQFSTWCMAAVLTTTSG